MESQESKSKLVYAIKETSRGWLAWHRYTEFSTNILSAVTYSTIDDAKEALAMYTEELDSEYNFKIHAIEIQDLGAIE